MNESAHPIPLQIDFPEDLPVSARRGEIMAAMDQHQVIIVCGETGSGKTTQLPKIALMLGRGKLNAKPGERARMIGHTQPRRIEDAAGRGGGFQGAVSRPVEQKRLGQAHARRHFAGRNPNRPAAAGL